MIPGDKTLPTPDPSQVQIIRSYGPGNFLIGERDWREPVLITRTAATAWSVMRAEDLSLASLDALKQAPSPTDLLILGCGQRAVFIAPAVRAELKAAGLALEVVDTGSACRIYNVLLAEGRRVGPGVVAKDHRREQVTLIVGIALVHREGHISLLDVVALAEPGGHRLRSGLRHDDRAVRDCGPSKTRRRRCSRSRLRLVAGPFPRSPA